MANEFVARNGLIAQDNSIISGSLIVTNGITGSISGTGSYANNANSASYSLTATSASYAVNASSAVSSSYALDATSASFATTASYWTGSVNAITSSFATNAGLLNSTGSNGFTTTGSFQTYTASNDLINTTQSARLTSLEGVSASFFSYTQSNDAKIASIYNATSSLQSATSSIQSFSSSILSYTASTNNSIGALNSFSSSILSYTSSTDARISSINLATSSLNAQTASLLSYTSSTDAKIASIYNNTSSLNAFSGSILNYTSSTDAKIAALYTYTSSLNNKTSSFATTGSNTFIGNQTITGSINVSGSINATGTLTAQTLIVQVITSSQDFVTGSTKFGSLTSNTHQFTGSVSASGSLDINGVSSTSRIIPNGTTYKTSNFLDFYPANDNVLFFHAGTSWGDPVIAVNGTTAGSVLTNSLAQQLVIRGDGAGGIGFSNGSSINMIISGGNVGIGTTSPTHILHIRKDQNAYTWARIENQADNSSAYTGLQLGAYGNSWGLAIGSSLANSNSLNFLIDAGGTNVSRMTILAGGNTGIGTTSPENTLHVYKGSAGTVTANSNSPLVVENNGSSYINILVPDANESGILFGRPTSNVDGGIIYNSNLSRGLEFRTAGNSYRMGITSAGNVGIGTTSPENILTVRAENGLVDVQSTGDGQTIGFLARYLNSATLGGGFKYTTGDAQLYIDNYYSGNNGVYSDINIRNCIADGGITTRIKIKGSSGNVGIGTTNPTALLHVSGTTGGVFEVDGASAVTALYVSASGQIGINTITPRTRTEFSSGLPTSIPTHTNKTNGIAVTDGGAIYGRIGVANLSAGGVGYPTYIQAGDWDGANYYNILLNPLGGRVSVGTTSPGYLFQVNGPSGDWSGYFKGSSSSGNSYGMFIDAGTTSADSPFMVRSADGATAFLRILGNGNVGIGTTSPNAKLHVAGLVNIYPASTDGELNISQAASSGGTTTVVLRSNGGSYFTGGNVGIGTTSPSYTLQVGQNTTGNNVDYGIAINRHGSLSSSGTYTTSSAFTISELSNAGPSAVDTQGIFNLTFGRYSETMTNAANASLMFVGYDGQWGPFRMDGRGNSWIGYDRTNLPTNSGTFGLLVRNGISVGTSYQSTTPPSNGAIIQGNVGIGTTSPGYRLDVSGDVRINAGITSYLYFSSTVGNRYLAYSGADTYWRADGAHHFEATSGMKGVWTSGGNLGIGTTSPIGKQHNIITSNGTALFLNNSTGGGGAFVDLDFTTYTTAQSGYANACATIRVIDDGNFSGHIVFRTKGGSIGASQTERARIEASTGHILPGANGTQNLGSDSLRWATVFTSDLDMSNGIGDYTIVEGEEDLFLYNNKTNKVFKFVIQEVDPSEATPKMKR